MALNLELRTMQGERKKLPKHQLEILYALPEYRFVYQLTGFVGISCRAVAMQALPLEPDRRKGVGWYSILYIGLCTFCLYTARCQWIAH